MTAKTGRTPMTPIDRLVGRRIRQQRIIRGWSMQQLAEVIGVSYQQAQKYETGINRISAGRLYQIAMALGQPIGWFFDQKSDEAEAEQLSSQSALGMNRAWLALSPALQEVVRDHIVGLSTAQHELERRGHVEPTRRSSGHTLYPGKPT